MESSVVSGEGVGVVINTGTNTYLGLMGKELGNKHQETNFDIGMKKITKLLLYYMIGTVFFVLIVDGLIKNNFSSAISSCRNNTIHVTDDCKCQCRKRKQEFS